MSALFELLEALDSGAPIGSSICACKPAITKDVMVTQKVAFGDEGDSFEVEVPVVTCETCGAGFMDERAERARHAAACLHQGLLTPAEVKAVRDRTGMTRTQFHEAYGIPPASMERWENGRLFQNRSMDSLLRVLQVPAFADRADRRKIGSTAAVAAPVVAADNVIHASFGVLAAKSPEDQRDILARSREFKLQARG